MSGTLTLVSIGAGGVAPQDFRYVTADSLATITSAGYINPIAAQSGYSIQPGDSITCCYNNFTQGAIFMATYSGAIITLVAIAGTNTSDVTGANLGSGTGVYAQNSGSVLQFKSLDAGTGMTISNTTTDVTITNNGVLGATNLGGTGLYTSVAANNIQLKGLTAGTGIQIASAASALTISATGYPIYADVTATHTTLATAGKVNLITAADGTAQYKVRELWLNLVGTNFSGGSGDRLLSITDGTNVYSVIPATDIQTLVNAGWGAVALPWPASVSINTSTVAGANLYMQYSGGTTDYTAGSLTVTIGYEQVTA